MTFLCREKTKTHMTDRLRKLLEKLGRINLKLNKDKCKIGLSEISYMGHVLSKDGLKPDKEKVRAILEMLEPQDKSAVLRFLGMLQYLAKFIPNLSEGCWKEKQQDSFYDVSQLVCGCQLRRSRSCDSSGGTASIVRFKSTDRQ